MPLILAVEPDRRQAHQLTSMVRHRLGAELVLADTAESALASVGDRVPDLILTTALLSTKDEAMLAEWLRSLDGAAHVQTLTIPVLETPAPRVSPSRSGIFALLGDRVSSSAAPDGCDPAVFAEQCAAYLERATTERGPIEPALDVEMPVVHHEPPPPLEEPPQTHEEIQAAVEEIPAAVETPAPEIGEPPAPPAPDPIEDSVEIDLSAMLDEAVFQQLSEAIETVSRDSARPVPATEGGVVWTPSSLGSAAVWPALDFTSTPQAQPASASTRSPAKRFPARKPIQDEWGFFDPAQCGFSALLAKLDEITHVASSLPAPHPPAGSLDATR